MKGIFITATDTGVGKTYIGCLIAEMLSKKLKVGVFKPFLTGNHGDAKNLRNAARSNLSLKEINPVFLKYPLAPYPSSMLERRKIDLKNVYRKCALMKKRTDFLIIEGAGGLFVPITKNFFMIDLIEKFRMPVVLVSRPGLGTINHTLLSIKALKEKGIKVAAVLLNRYTGKDLAQKTNPNVIRKLIAPPVFIVKERAKKLPGEFIGCILKKR